MPQAPQEIRTYFVTTVTANRRRLFQVTANAELLLQTIRDYRNKNKFLLHAYILMPDHIHLLVTPAPEISLEKAMQFIKGGFSFRLKSKMDVWEKGFNESQIQTPHKFQACRDYIEANPVRKRLAISPSDYPYSSAATESLDPAPVHLQG